MQNNISVTREWVRVRKRLFNQAKEQVSQRLGGDVPGLAPYEKEYQSEFRRSWSPAKKQELIQGLLRADLVLLGDFHALQQSQRSHLRILKDLVKERPVWLGVECFSPKDQNILDRYMDGQISEKKFLIEVKWQDRWGFPWEHYEPLFSWAKKNKVKIYGVNTFSIEKGLVSLRKRDDFTAEQVTRIARSNPGQLGVIIFGDLHLAKSHLPAKINGHRMGRGLKIVRVFQNAEKIYFRLALLKMENKVDLVRLGAKDFCIFSVPPWVKWQNYLLFLEKTYDLELDEENLLDCTDHVVRQVQFVSLELGIKIDTAKLSIYTAGDPDFLEKVEDGLSRAEFLLVKNLIDMERSFYLPSLQLGFLGRLSVNHTASLAMEFIHAELSGRKGLSLIHRDDFIRQIWIQSINYLGSKMINHKRKTDTLEDIRSSLRSHDRQNDMGKEALLIALQQKIKEVSFLTSGRRSMLELNSRQRSSYWEAARLLGGMMGERLYNSLHKGQIKKSLILKLMKAAVEDDAFEQFYLEVIELVESLPNFKSKRERL